MKFAAFFPLLLALPLLARFPEATPDSPGKRMLDRYFEQQVRQIEEEGGLKHISTAEEWKAHEPEYRRQLAEMLGLDPMPERTPLMPVKTGELNGEGYRIEKMHYQALPGYYVTANLYLPEKVEAPCPAILYVCGHANVVKDGVSLGNKTGYHHHGIWFARHGYVCLIIDTVQLGEIRGEHHGTYSKGRWWWFSRGYTPAGLEAWAGIRALDFLETRPEVDKTRFGVTGRSGGGAYSWWVAALDERIKAAAPTAGVTSMKNHVVDGCVEGHCDCMFFVNTYRWDYDRLVALVAPRPLLIVNTDKDSIFPIDGVFQIYQNVRRLYTLLGEEKNIGLQVAEGPHADLQPLNMGAFHWFERHLKGASPMQVMHQGAEKSLDPMELRVLAEIPADERNTTIDETFVPRAEVPAPPTNDGDWEKQSARWMQGLREKVFAGWPKDAPGMQAMKEGSLERDGIQMSVFDLETEKPFRLRLFLTHRAGLRAQDLELVALNVLDEQGWQDFCNTYGSRFAKLFEVFPQGEQDEAAFASEQKMHESFQWGMAYLCPRGIGPTEWAGSEKAQTQRLRRFYLAGQTLDSMRVWDIRRAIQGVREIGGLKEMPLWLQAHRDMAANALYAALFEEGITRLDLHDLPTTHMQGPTYLNVLKILDMPQAAALAAARTRVVLYTADETPWEFTSTVAKNLSWSEKKWQVRKPPSQE